MTPYKYGAGDQTGPVKAGEYARAVMIPVPLQFVETVAICSACGHQNDLDSGYCSGCRVSLDRAIRVTVAEAERLARLRRRADLRRLAVRWAIVSLVVLVLGSLVLRFIGPLNDPPDPSSDISSAPQTPDDWPMFQRDPSHGASAESIEFAPAGVVAWTFETSAPFESSPAVVDGTVFVSTGDHRIVALDAVKGAVRWQTEVTGPVASSPAIADGLLFVGLKDGRFLALSTADGSLQWEYKSDDIVYASPIVRDGLVYIGSSDRRLYALDAGTGERHWSFEANGRFLTGAGAIEHVVAAVSQDRRVYVLDPVNGRHRLQFALSAAANGSPVLDQDLMYVANNAGVVVGLNWKQVEVPFERTARWMRLQLFVWGFVATLPPPKGWVWTRALPRESFDATPALGHGMLYVASESGNVFALDRLTGRSVWRFSAEGRIAGSASLAGGTLLIADGEGFLYGIDAMGGEEKWRFSLGDGIVSTPVVSGDTIYMTSAGGVLYAVR